MLPLGSDVVFYEGGGTRSLELMIGKIVDYWRNRNGNIIGYIVRTDDTDQRILPENILEENISRREFEAARIEAEYFSDKNDKLRTFQLALKGGFLNPDGRVESSVGAKRYRSRSPRVESDRIRNAKKRIDEFKRLNKPVDYTM